MREVRKNAMRKSKFSGNKKTNRKNHNYNKGDNMEYRPLYPVMNRVHDIESNSRATFEGFINAVSIVVGFWTIVTLAFWMF